MLGAGVSSLTTRSGADGAKAARPVTHPLAPGAALQGGHYVIDRPLGAGGMGSVFLGHDPRVNNKPVVIKEMVTSFATAAERREAEAAFKAEMATLASLSHPNIPQISDFFTTNQAETLADAGDITAYCLRLLPCARQCPPGWGCARRSRWAGRLARAAAPGRACDGH
jgi:serine/threonine protein kinase